MGLLSKILLTDDRLDHEIQNNPLRNPEILGTNNFQLIVWNQDDNIARENKSDHIQKAYQDNEGLT